MKINIAIADDHRIVVEGMARLLRAQKILSVAGTYTSGADLLRGLEEQLPDVLLLDIHFPDTSGHELVRLIAPRYPSLRIIALTSVDNLAEVRDMLQQGCAGYILKNTSLPVLLQAIQAVHAGGTFLDPELKEQLLQEAFRPADQAAKEPVKLTQREQQILALVAAGHTSTEIAAQLFLSYRTIQNNRLTLYQKFGVHNTAELIRVALQAGLIR